ncbi:hypothetical protein SYNTR_1172 [Candidatus Syntrophocurvum alkaliphilum]|uniref:Uncharacterized protein n=1 Tax=Candidatus Syntrophocurvum alkaliphilum TaxID=2293317 RepID=A0A6I6DAL9_9FIRM|nr:hypothetical protein [Candidatus Syntrophocurvum alkaliphilum]QGT99765.1 hypothetical protein SYNTR_1172 [Candidatus Syntrophocurvum alkaliphilum]
MDDRQIYIGVFVRKPVIDRLRKQKPTYSITCLESAGRKVGNIVYFFSEQEVDLKKHLIIGAYYSEKEQRWLQKTFPYPDVLYNRRAEGTNSKKVQLFRDTVKKLGVTQNS